MNMLQLPKVQISSVFSLQSENYGYGKRRAKAKRTLRSLVNYAKLHGDFSSHQFSGHGCPAIKITQSGIVFGWGEGELIVK
jgi:hypothetical protein